MANLIEFKVTKTLFDDVKNDPGFRIGFEAEFHVSWASDLLADENDNLPEDFETFATYQNYHDQPQLPRANSNSLRPQNDIFHEKTTLYRLARLFETYLGLSNDSISLDDTGYKQWTLMVDPSLYEKPAQLANPDDDIGVELISPILPLREGLAWMAKVCEMIEKFRYQRSSLYTTETCSLHVNLSHARMANFDFAKLAVLGGDQHYLHDFDRVKNKYTVPLLRAIYDLLVTAKQNPAGIEDQTRRIGLNAATAQPAAMGLLNLRGWSPQRVMTDMAAVIPMSHNMSIDLRRLNSTNPYIEIRIAGNRQYEKRYDEIAQLAIRFGALIKIACDPQAYREEYLKKVYQLVANVASAPPEQQQPPQPVENPFPRAHIYLAPIMTTATRQALGVLETFWRKQSLTTPYGSYMILAIIRSAIDLRQTENPRVRMGVMGLLQSVLRITPADLMKALKDRGMLANQGIIRSNDKHAQVLAAMTNYVKSLSGGKVLQR